MSELTGQAANSGADVGDDRLTSMLVSVFDDEQAALSSLDTLRARNDGHFAGVVSATVLRKDRHGKLHIKESVDTGDGCEGVLDGAVGAGIGVMSGPALVAPSTVEALISGLAENLRASAFPSERLHHLGKDLAPGASVIISVVHRSALEQLSDVLAKLGARTFAEQLDFDIVAQLKAGHDIAYATLVSRDSLTSRRAGDFASDSTGGLLVVDDPGATASRFMTTEKGFAVRAIDVSGARTSERETDP